MIPPRYPSVIRIQYKVYLPRRPSHAVLLLLWYAYLLQYLPHHHTNHNVENHGVCGAALSNSSPCPKRCPQELTYLRDYPHPADLDDVFGYGTKAMVCTSEFI